MSFALSRWPRPAIAKGKARRHDVERLLTQVPSTNGLAVSKKGHSKQARAYLRRHFTRMGKF
jgi:hypothetical protein